MRNQPESVLKIFLNLVSEILIKIRNKCKELRISFAKEQRVFDPVIIEGKEVEFVTSTKLLGLLYFSERSKLM